MEDPPEKKLKLYSDDEPSAVREILEAILVPQAPPTVYRKLNVDTFALFDEMQKQREEEWEYDPLKLPELNWGLPNDHMNDRSTSLTVLPTMDIDEKEMTKQRRNSV